MATFVATTASNDPVLGDVDAARRILDRYFFDGDFQAEIQEDGDNGGSYLSICGYDWPGAWKIPDGVAKDGYEPDYELDPDEGFDEFLKEIAPFLAEPLTIQAIGTEKCRFPISACEWHVRPGATEIEVNGFRHSCPETMALGSAEGDLPTPDVTGTIDA